MTLRSLADDLRDSHKNQPSLEDQIAVLCAHYWVGTRPNSPYLTKRETEEILEEMALELNCNRSTAFGNLEQFNVLDGFQPEDLPSWFVIRQRDGKFVMGDDFPPAVTDEIERAISHIQSMDRPPEGDDQSAVADGGSELLLNDDGQTLREEIAEEIEVHPSKLEDNLRDGRARDRRSKLNEVVEVIEKSNTFENPGSYDTIELIPCALRHHLTEEILNEYNLS